MLDFVLDVQSRKNGRTCKKQVQKSACTNETMYNWSVQAVCEAETIKIN